MTTSCSNNFSYENRYQVIFGNEDFAGLNNKIVDLTLPSFNIGLISQPTNIKEIFIPGDSLDIGEINITFLLDEDYNNYKLILNWLNTLRNFREVDLNRYVTDISIIMLDAKYKESFTLVCQDCFPYNISEVFLNQQIVETDPVRFLTVFKVNGVNWT